MSLTGDFTLNWHGDQAKAAIREGAADGLAEAAEYVRGEAVKIVPLEEATLARSAVASVDRGALKAAVSFDTPYAVIQHERLDFRHDAGRQAKYLEAPLNGTVTVQRQLLAAAIRRRLA